MRVSQTYLCAANERGDTLIEVTISLVILTVVLISGTAVAMSASNLGQTAKERTQVSNEAQEQAEAVRDFYDHNKWTVFLYGGAEINNSPGVVNAGDSNCATTRPCFHMEVTSFGGVTEFLPVPGKISGTVPTSYIEILAEPGPGATPSFVDITVSYGFVAIGSNKMETGHIKTRFTDLSIASAAAAPAAAPPPPGPPPPCGSGPDRDVLLVLDASSSMGRDWETMTRQAKLKSVVNNFINNTQVASPNNHEGIIQFNTLPTKLSDYTSSTTQLHNAMDNYNLSGGTRYTPALTLAGTMINDANTRPASPKVIVFISDGLVDGFDTPADAIAAARALKNQGAEFFTIGIIDPTDPKYALATATLQAMAGNGGTFANAAREAQLDSLMGNIASDVDTGC